MRKHVSRGVKRGTPDSVMDVDIVACLLGSVCVPSCYFITDFSRVPLPTTFTHRLCFFLLLVRLYTTPSLPSSLLASFTDSLKLKHSPECA